VNNIIFVSHESADVWELDGATNTATRTIGPVGGDSPAIGLNGVTRLLFVPNGDTPGAVWRLDAAAGSVLGSVSVAGVPAVVGVDQVRDLATIPTTTDVHFMIGSTGTMVHSLPVGTASQGVGVNSATGKVFIVDPVRHSVVIVRY
jgi:DNA-binding beta-propeller fold protein YncE